MNGVSFSVRGIPMPKGSTTRMPNGATLPAGTSASRKRAGEWRADIKQAAIEAMNGQPPFKGPIRLMVEFSFPPPRTTIRKYQWGWLPHTKRPDVDKLERMLFDAIKGVIYLDDSQVCFSAVNKVYAWDGISGAEIDIAEISEESSRSFAKQSAEVRKAIDQVRSGAYV